MVDINAELDRLLNEGSAPGSSAPEAKALQPVPAEATQARDYSGDLDKFLGEQPQAAPAGPDLNSELDALLGAPAVDEGLPSNGAFSQVPAEPTPSPLTTTQEAPVAPPVEGEPGFLSKAGSAFAGGVGRGAAQVAATPYDLAGIAAEATGNEEAAQSAFESARRVEAYAGPSEYTWDDVNDAESFGLWLAEKFGEQAPVYATLFTGAGAGGLAARLVGKGLLKSSSARALATRGGMAVGGAGTGMGLETAGTGSELKGATGSYQPGTAVAAGAVKGMLEWYGPASLIKGMANPASTILGEGAKMFVREGATEAAQEVVDAAARAFEDEKYGFWSRETYVRVRESALAGAFVGGGVGVGGKLLGKAAGLDQQTEAPLEQDTAPKVDPKFDDESTWFTPLAWLRRKFGKKSKIGEDATLEPTDDPAVDYSEQGTLFAGVRRSWELAGINQEQVDSILDFEDALTPRYLLVGKEGKALDGKVMSSTEAELAMSLLPQGERPRILQVDLKKMNAGSLTAHELDLPESGNDSRIFFRPGVAPEIQQQLRQQYETAIGQQIKENQRKALSVAGMRTEISLDIAELYAPLVEAGLRVIPSRGSGFIYRGEVFGEQVYDVQDSGRMSVVLNNSGKLVKGSRLKRPMAEGWYRDEPTTGPYTYPVTIDFNKLKWEDGYSIGGSQLFDFPRGAEESYRYVLYRDPNLSVEEKHALRMRLIKASTDAEFRQIWQDGAMYDPKKADIAEFVLERDVGSERQTPGVWTPGNDLADEKRANRPAPDGKKGKISVDSYLEDEIKSNVTSEKETIDLAKQILAAGKEIAPVLQELGAKMGMGAFDVKFTGSVPGTAVWNGGERSITLGVGSVASALRAGIFSTNDVKLATWRIMLHEFGHGLTLDKYTSLEARWRVSLRSAYERARLYERMTGDWSKTNPALPGSTLQLSPNSYYLKYSEWLTEQFVRWSISGAVPRTENEVFFQRMAREFRKYGEEFVKLVGPEKARNIMQPSWQFADALNYLWKASQGGVKAMVRRVDRIDAIREMTAYDETVKALQEFRNIIPADVRVEVMEGESDVQAEYLSDDRILRLWAGSLAQDGTDPYRAVAHEAGHACWPLFTERERTLLVEAAREARTMGRDEVNHYREFYNSQGYTKEEVDALVDEERVMYLLDARAAGGKFTPQVNGLLDALLEMLKRVKNMLAGLGFQTHNDIIRSFYLGEIAARERQTEIQSAIRKARLATDGREKWINPEKVEQVEGDLYLAVERFPEGAMLRFYKAPEAGTQLTGEPQADLMQLGEEVGYLSLTWHGELKGYDVDMVQVNDKFAIRSPRQLKELGGETYVQKFTRYGEKEMGRRFKASGIMTEAGYRSRRRFAPDELRWHVFDEVSRMWYSPNYIEHQLKEWQVELEKAQRGEKSLYDRTSVQGIMSKWRRLKAKVDPAAWIDPDLPNQFMTDAATNARIAQAEAMFGINRKAAEQDENQLLQSITGEAPGPTQSDFDRVDAQAQAQSKAENRRLLGLDDLELAAERQPETALIHAILPRGEDSPTVGPILSGRRTNIPGEADRISKFSKLLMGIQQIAWRNQHLRPMQIFVSLINQMQAQRMKWIARADETSKIWDREMNERDRVGLTDLLFWATEMEYRTAAEVAAGVVRHPTAQELQRFVTQNRLGPQVLIMYDRVQGDFNAFLAEVERVTVKNLQRQFLTGANPNQVGYQAALAELQADMANMRKRPYFPMVRFGQWTITIRDPAQNDQVIYFGAYATERERDRAIRQMAGNHYGHNIQAGRVTEDLQEFMGLPAPILRALKNDPNFNLSASQQDWLDTFINQHSAERSFRKRWLQRKGTPGYSLDGIRTYSHYFLSGANYLAKLDYKEEIQDQIQALRQTLPLLADTKKRSLIIEAMQSAFKYIMEGGRDWAKFKSFVSLWQLGFSPAAAAMNLLQSPTVTLPYFSGIYGNGAYVLMSSIANGLKRAGLSFRPQGQTTQFDAARAMLQQMGKIDVGQAPELGAYAEGYNLLNMSAGTRVQRAWRQLSHLGMAMFAVAERINREIAFGMSWHYSSQQPNHDHLQQIELTYLTEINSLQGQQVEVDGQMVTINRDTAIAIVAAREAIDRTQFVYAPWARPGFLRNPLASSFLVFFQYTQAMIYAFGNNPGRVKMFLIYASLFGLLGLPGADDLDEVLNAIAKRIFGKEFSLEAEARKFARDLTKGTVFDEVGPDLLMHGISKYSFGPGLLQEGYGIPQFDASANGSLGQVVPGLAQAANAIGNRRDWKDITAEVARDTAGAGFGQMFSLLQFLQADPFSADRKKWESVMPRAVRALSKASRYYQEEKERTNQGGELVDFDVRDPDDLATIAAQAFGFTPTEINQKWAGIRAVNDTYQYFYGRKLALMAQYSEALMWRDKEAAANVRSRILDYNRELKDRKLTGLSITSDGLKQSMRGRATARAMQNQGLPAQKSQIQIQRQMGKEMYPGVWEQKVK